MPSTVPVPENDWGNFLQSLKQNINLFFLIWNWPSPSFTLLILLSWATGTNAQVANALEDHFSSLKDSTSTAKQSKNISVDWDQ